MTFYQEIVIILTIGLIGALSDKFGRKPIYVAAFALIAVGYVLYPLAQSVDQLILYRLVFACGFACNTAMLPSVANDYPQEPARAKMLAVCFTLNGLGFIVILTPLRFLLPFFSEIANDAGHRGALLVVVRRRDLSGRFDRIADRPEIGCAGAVGKARPVPGHGHGSVSAPRASRESRSPISPRSFRAATLRY